jgi:DNA repair exonuclease SbcCD ATPase subunit
MIRRISLRNWRAYELAEIRLEVGTTFIVAPNGVGKSSLLEAAQFALSGQLANPVSPVMFGEDEASVELSLQLPGGTVLVVTRTVSADPSVQPQLRVALNDRELTDREFVAELDHAFRASPEFISRNAFLRDSLRDVDHTGLRPLLARAFDLDAKKEDAAQLAQLADDLKVTAEKLSKDLRSEAKATGRLEGELVGAQRELDQAEKELTRVRAVLDEATAARTAFLEQAAAVQRSADWDAASTEVIEQARAFLPGVSVDTLTADIEELASQVETDVAAVQARAAAVTARIELIDTALGELNSAGSDGPVCRRPLGDQAREVAEAGHRAEADRLRAELEQLNPDAAAGRLATIRQLVRRVDALGPRPPAPAPQANAPGDPQAAYDQARIDLERAASEHQAAQSVVATMTAALDEARSVEERSAQSERAWRRWALTSAASTALSEAVDDVLRNEIIPVGDAVRSRWNELFADREDLHFDLDGNQWRNVRGHRLGVEGFSAGEQTAARLLMQLAILTTATTVDFCWLDEPLEHLDPKTRRLVAGMLSHGRKATGLRQLVVTTYEEDLTVQLEATDELTFVEYVRAGPANEQPR